MRLAKNLRSKKSVIFDKFSRKNEISLENLNFSNIMKNLIIQRSAIPRLGRVHKISKEREPKFDFYRILLKKTKKFGLEERKSLKLPNPSRVFSRCCGNLKIHEKNRKITVFVILYKFEPRTATPLRL